MIGARPFPGALNCGILRKEHARFVRKAPIPDKIRAALCGARRSPERFCRSACTLRIGSPRALKPFRASACIWCCGRTVRRSSYQTPLRKLLKSSDCFNIAFRYLDYFCKWLIVNDFISYCAAQFYFFSYDLCFKPCVDIDAYVGL